MASDQLRYTVLECSLGFACVALSEKGIAALELGDDRESLLGYLARRFPGTVLVDGSAELEDLAGAVGALIDRGTPLDRPLDVEGTDFQRSVWDAISRIPRGDTRTYSEVAEQIGRPRAVRAVATACGANRHAVVIPCHRVVAADGGMSGYRWGVERKRALLQRESAN